MFIIQSDSMSLCADAIARLLRPGALVDQVVADKVVDIAAARARLRPTPAKESLASSLTP
jgi:hypothetical protein